MPRIKTNRPAMVVTSEAIQPIWMAGNQSIAYCEPSYLWTAFVLERATRKKINSPRVKRKKDNTAKAGASYWDRLNSDPEFVKAKHEIQERFNLPLPHDIFRENNRAWLAWLGIKDNLSMSEKGQAFFSDVQRLFEKFNIPEEWHRDLIGVIAGSPSGHSLGVEVKGRIYWDAGGNVRWEAIITPETDLKNPLVFASIQALQKRWAGDPPQPVKDKTNPRKLDWRPVWEWAKTHPQFTIKEIALRLNRDYTDVKRRLKQLDR